MNPWNVIFLQPIINVLIVLYDFLFSNFGLAIIALTVVVNLAIMPLTRRQVRSSRTMQAMQPKMIELQKKHARDKQKLAQEQMKLYRESGMSPLGCAVPLLIQMPVWIALYQSITRILAVTPEGFLTLSQFLYSWPIVNAALPINSQFLWLNLAVRDPTYIMAVLVGVTMWLQQKSLTPPSADARQQSQNQMMLWMMPIMFAFLTLSFPSGLALYWVVSGAFRGAVQYFGTRGPKPQKKVRIQSSRDDKLKKRIERSVKSQ